MQVDEKKGKMSTIDATLEILKEGGVGALYKGLGLSINLLHLIKKVLYSSLLHAATLYTSIPTMH